MATVHPTAIVDAAADLAETVHIGPYAVIGADVSIDAGTRVGAHCVIEWAGAQDVRAIRLCQVNEGAGQTKLGR